jgi:hypothetical protein
VEACGLNSKRGGCGRPLSNEPNVRWIRDRAQACRKTASFEPPVGARNLTKRDPLGNIRSDAAGLQQMMRVRSRA